MDLHVNWYIRTNDGDLAQITVIADGFVDTDIGYIYYGKIKNCKEDLRDLIEEGDYVNGERIYYSNNRTSLCHNGNSIKSINVMQFMTKEKFFRECYSPRIKKGQKIKWKKLKDYPNYEVSNTGLVRNRLSGKLMSLSNDRKQCHVKLTDKKGHRCRKSVGVLVLEAFVEPSDGRVPVYINNDSGDCNLENLKWGTRAEQAKISSKKRVTRNRHTKDLSDEEVLKKKKENEEKKSKPKKKKEAKVIKKEIDQVIDYYNKYPKNTSFDREPTKKELEDIKREEFKRILLKKLKED